MVNLPADVVIVGVGVAGLSAAHVLSAHGKRVVLLEGRDRIGGRIYTHRTLAYPVELGAEFVHGRPPEICTVAEGAGLRLAELQWNVLRRKDGRWLDAGEAMSGIDLLFAKMPSTGQDETFCQFLARTNADADAKEQALGFVEGFHAADPARISVQSLVKSNAAEEQIDGDRQFRFADGYEGLVRSIAGRIDWQVCKLELNTIATEIDWKTGEAVVRTASGRQFLAPRVLVTVPLGVLKAGSLHFHPRLPEKEKALQGLEMGPVVRASLCFRDQFWKTQARFNNLSFIFTDDPHFPTWWSSNPLPFPILTGWAAGHYARALGNLTSQEVIRKGGRIVGKRSGVASFASGPGT